MPEVPEPGFSHEPETPVTDAGQSAGRDTPRFCGGRLRQPSEAHDGTTCTRPAGWGTEHVGFGTCKLHGGNTPTHIAAAERERVEHQLTVARRTYGLPIDVEPGEALLGLVRTAAGIVAWLSLQVGQLPNDGVTGEGRTHPLVSLYLEERKHLAQVSKDTLAAGVAERRVRLEEAQGQLLVGLLERIIRRLGADPMDPAVRDIVREELTAIEGGQAA